MIAGKEFLLLDLISFGSAMRERTEMFLDNKGGLDSISFAELVWTAQGSIAKAEKLIANEIKERHEGHKFSKYKGL